MSNLIGGSLSNFSLISQTDQLRRSGHHSAINQPISSSNDGARQSGLDLDKSIQEHKENSLVY